MTGLIGGLDSILFYVVEVSTILMEMAGICVLMATAFRCFYDWVRRSEKNIRLELGEGIALALEFKMGGEVLRTVVVREWRELGILGAIILLRGALTFLIHWEIKNEKKEQKEQRERAAGRRELIREQKKHPHEQED